MSARGCDRGVPDHGVFVGNTFAEGIMETKKARKAKPKFRVKFFGIGKSLSEEYLGEAHDATTAISLLKGARARGFYAASVHGVSVNYKQQSEDVSGEYSIDSLLVEFLMVKERGF